MFRRPLKRVDSALSGVVVRQLSVSLKDIAGRAGFEVAEAIKNVDKVPEVNAMELPLDAAVKKLQAYKTSDAEFLRSVDLIAAWAAPEEISFNALPLQQPSYYQQRLFKKSGSLSDIKEHTLFGAVSDRLGLPYLSEVKADCNWSTSQLNGVIFGILSRPMFSIPVQRKDKKLPPIWVHFIGATGAPSTEISPTAMQKILGLKPGDYLPDKLVVLIAGQLLEISLCAQQGDESNNKDVPVLGQDFYKLLKAKYIADYKDLTCQLICQD